MKTRALLVLLGTLAAAGWMLRLDFVSRPFLILFATLNLVFLLTEKLVLRLGARRLRSRGYNYRTLLIVGINPRAEEVARIISDHPHWGLQLLGFVAPTGAHPDQAGGLPVLGAADDLPRILQEEVVDEVIFVLSRRQLEEFEDAFLLCAELGIRARVALYFPHMKARVVLEELEGIPLLTFTTTPGAPFPLFLKRLGDIGASTLGIGSEDRAGHQHVPRVHGRRIGDRQSGPSGRRDMPARSGPGRAALRISPRHARQGQRSGIDEVLGLTSGRGPGL